MQNYFFILNDFVGTLLSPAKHINNQARSDLPYNLCDNRLYFLKKFGTNIVVLEIARPGLFNRWAKANTLFESISANWPTNSHMLKIKKCRQCFWMLN